MEQEQFMSDYKRFISYLYEYEGNTKKENRGFLKVECRNGVCKMEFSLRGMCGDGQMKIYGFRRKEGRLWGSLLHVATVKEGALEEALSWPEEEMGEGRFVMGELAGVILRCERDVFYASQWDDEPLDFAEFSEVSGEEEEEMEPGAGEEELGEEEEDSVQATSTRQPFDGEEVGGGVLVDCRRVDFGEISRLDPRDRHLANNRFVHYGYQLFGHLLVGRLEESGEMVLGVPGTYHRQECMMAGMFGFPDFIRCPGRDRNARPFGYWYRSIHSADLNQGDGFS